MNKPMSFNKHLCAISVLLVMLLLCSGGEPVIAQANSVDLNTLIDETQKMHPDADRMTMVWWVPDDFWRASFAHDPTISKAQADAFVNALSPYTLFVVVDGRIGVLGGVTYKSEDTVRETIQLIDSQGAVYRPLGKEKIDADIRNLLVMMKPMLSNMMGQMGANMNFIVFPSKSAAGQKIADARREGSFAVKLSDSKFEWKLPLGAVLPAKICPVDGERLNGAWKFCPWHGDKLILKPDK